MRKTAIAAVVVSFFVSATAAIAGSWTLDPAMSNIAFGSIKNDTIGEVHRFNDLSGGVSEDGTVTIEVALGSVNTLIPIRDERMIEHVFNNLPAATISAQVDMEALNSLVVGEATTIETEGTLSFLDKEVTLNAPLFVMRLSEGQVMVVSDGMTMLGTSALGIDPGVEVLRQLASLDSITRVSPVVMRLVFDLNS